VRFALIALGIQTRAFGSRQERVQALRIERSLLASE
jgi:hypothetical protein